ncbi:MAG: bifunctional 2-C-methyl-D-erythritol 4-phosphate cytidylyltransferase/2-C-methyl-D-erythritol [Glaciihabitans sp.]|nr:bifunctional 2-C-methyl-D-erythritol 4-phosphate cytidylyltransferase/2-C-methyl-D-erythritol [Glaciihabitans sp.]
MLCEVGETVVYPQRGAATLIAVNRRIVRGEKKVYLTLDVMQGDLVIEVPADSVDLVGIRDVVSHDGLAAVFDVLGAPVADFHAAPRPTRYSSCMTDSSTAMSPPAPSPDGSAVATNPPANPATAFHIEAPASESGPRVAVVVVAAGSGTRLAQPQPKAFVMLRGSTLLARALESVFAMTEPAQVVVVAPADWIAEATTIAVDVAGVASSHISVVAGGATRQLSVAAGLAVIGADVDTVLVHDSARALTPPELLDAVVAQVRSTGDGVIPGLPVSDTIKRTADGVALETVDRSTLSAVQTPQGFPRVALQDAYHLAREDYTDDAALYSAAGHTVRVVLGDPLAFKITTAWDLRRAESLLPGEPVASGLRTGIGIDVHAYDPASPLWLGGLYWPDEVGLAGHSDGDAVAHAICDALLSAAGLGDIGGRFGTADPRFENAHGEIFLVETLALVVGAGFSVANVAVQVVGNGPRMSPRRVEVEQNLTRIIGAPVSVSATTTDALGFTGRGEGLTAVATALLTS